MKKLMITRIILFLIVITVFIPATLPAEDDLIFIVRPGDTERSLTENYLVRPTAWERVVQYNYLLKPGGTIKVPADLVRKEESAFLVSFSGEVEFRQADRRDWMPAVAGLILRKGDAVRTGTDSGAVLRMGRDDQVVLRGESEVIFDPYRRFLSGRTNRVLVTAGTVLASTRKSDDREARFEIKTPAAEMELTGTLVRTSVATGRSIPDRGAGRGGGGRFPGRGVRRLRRKWDLCEGMNVENHIIGEQ